MTEYTPGIIKCLRLKDKVLIHLEYSLQKYGSYIQWAEINVLGMLLLSYLYICQLVEMTIYIRTLRIIFVEY